MYNEPELFNVNKILRNENMSLEKVNIFEMAFVLLIRFSTHTLVLLEAYFEIFYKTSDYNLSELFLLPIVCLSIWCMFVHCWIYFSSPELKTQVI